MLLSYAGYWGSSLCTRRVQRWHWLTTLEVICQSERSSLDRIVNLDQAAGRQSTSKCFARSGYKRRIAQTRTYTSMLIRSKGLKLACQGRLPPAALTAGCWQLTPTGDRLTSAACGGTRCQMRSAGRWQQQSCMLLAEAAAVAATDWLGWLGLLTFRYWR